MAKEPEYGETTKARKQSTAAPLPVEPNTATPEELAQQVVAATVEGAPTVAQSATVAQSTQQPQPGQQTANMWRLPQDYSGVLGQEHKPAAQRTDDIALFWQVLAADAQSDPMTRAIAASMTGNKTSG